MVDYRTFRNQDAPGLMTVWNNSVAETGGIRLATSTPLEHLAFAKIYFDPAGLFVAEEDGEIIGYAHAGFGPNQDESSLSDTVGVISLIAVQPQYRNRGVGSQLLQRCETYLIARGAARIIVGAYPFGNPFYFGLYGGSNTPGVLQHNQLATEFFTHRGYEIQDSILVFQKKLQQAGSHFDPRFAKHRKLYDLEMNTPKQIGTWWLECLFAQVEPFEFSLCAKTTNETVATALVWELREWNAVNQQNGVGIGNLIVPEDKRRQGLAKFLVTQILQHVRAQYFDWAEIQVRASSEEGKGLCASLGFEETVSGLVFCREIAK